MGPFLAIRAMPLLLVLGMAASCTRGRRAPPSEGGHDFGAVGAPLPSDSESLGIFEMARAILEKHPRGGGSTPGPAAGRRALLAFWPPGEQPLVATANGPTLADSVARAAEALQPRISNPVAGRIELDLPTSFEAVLLDELGDVPLSAIGFEGVLITRDDGRTGFVLPGEVAQRGLFRLGSPPRLDSSRIASLIAARAGVSEAEALSMRAYRFRADSHIESSQQNAALRLFRGMIEGPPLITPERLLAAARSGADYLTRILSGEGRYQYIYRAAEDRDDSSYGWLRHAGTTYALLEAYEEFGAPAYLKQAELALRYLASHLSNQASSQGKFLLDTNDEEEQGVGGAGLALVAFSKHAAVTGRRDNLEMMRALARYILKRQYDDGHFRSNIDLEHETGQKLKREPVYYTGEALLGLMRLFAVDPQPAYLEAARRGADWVVRVRDAYVSEDNQEHDHWITYALNELYRVTRDDAYVNHACKIGRAIRKKQHNGLEVGAPDLVGTFYEGQTTPASTRLEAYDASIVLLRFVSKPEDWLLTPAKEVARSILGQQFDAENGYWLKNPRKAMGGVRESLIVNDIRIDYVQHAISAWLHLARILRDPLYGKAGVPSQDPLRRADTESTGGRRGGVDSSER